MALSAFDDRSTEPGEPELGQVLGRAAPAWNLLTTLLAEKYEPLTETWKFSGAKWGWSLQLKRRKRTVLYLTPGRSRFVVGFALDEKAVRAAHESGLPPAVLDIIDSATKYAEGRAVRLEVRNQRDARAVERLAAIKMAN